VRTGRVGSRGPKAPARKRRAASRTTVASDDDDDFEAVNVDDDEDDDFESATPDDDDDDDLVVVTRSAPAKRARERITRASGAHDTDAQPSADVDATTTQTQTTSVTPAIVPDTPSVEQRADTQSAAPARQPRVKRAAKAKVRAWYWR
jgi:hypothetical protein